MAKTVKKNNPKNINASKMLKEFNSTLFDEATCRKFILNRLYPYGPVCPHCDVKITDKTTLNNFDNNNRCICKKCLKSFTALTGTFLFKTHLSFKDIMALAVFTELHKTNLKIKDIAALLDISTDTVHNWINKFKYFDFKVLNINDNRK